MSAFLDTDITPAEDVSILDAVRRFVVAPHDAVIISLVVNGLHEEWQVFNQNELSERYREVVLRKSMGEFGTAGYIMLLIDESGREFFVAQRMLIQNDKDYVGRGFDRFGTIRLGLVDDLPYAGFEQSW